jgi:hypothetical protein
LFHAWSLTRADTSLRKAQDSVVTRVFCPVLFALLLSPSIASAQDAESSPAEVVSPLIDAHRSNAHGDSHAVLHHESRKGSAWPFRLTMGTLYTTTIVAQVYDVDSTLKSMRRGGVEMNPLMSFAFKNEKLFLAIKASGVAATIWAAHHTGKRHKVSAILTMVALNAAYYAIIQNNYAIARRPTGE